MQPTRSTTEPKEHQIAFTLRSSHYKEPIRYSSDLDDGDWEKILALEWQHDGCQKLVEYFHQRQNAPLPWKEINRRDPKATHDGRLICLRLRDAINARFRKSELPYRLRSTKTIMRLKHRTFAIFKIMA